MTVMKIEDFEKVINVLVKYVDKNTFIRNGKPRKQFNKKKKNLSSNENWLPKDINDMFKLHIYKEIGKKYCLIDGCTMYSNIYKLKDNKDSKLEDTYPVMLLEFNNEEMSKTKAFFTAMRIIDLSYNSGWSDTTRMVYTKIRNKLLINFLHSVDSKKYPKLKFGESLDKNTKEYLGNDMLYNLEMTKCNLPSYLTKLTLDTTGSCKESRNAISRNAERIAGITNENATQIQHIEIEFYNLIGMQILNNECIGYDTVNLDVIRDIYNKYNEPLLKILKGVFFKFKVNNPNILNKSINLEEVMLSDESLSVFKTIFGNIVLEMSFNVLRKKRYVQLSVNDKKYNSLDSDYQLTENRIQSLFRILFKEYNVSYHFKRNKVSIEGDL